MNADEKQETHSHLPIAKNEDVEFAVEQADENDLEAVLRAHAADDRQERE